MTNYYIADWHYNHKNVLHFDNRPFLSVVEMNAALISNWNNTVRPEDTVYVLGDMFWTSPKEAVPILRKLLGHKILIQGNHDRCHDSDFVREFEEITSYKEIQDDGRDIVLCHYPISYFKNHFYGWYHFYGHVHTSFEYEMVQHDRFLMENLYGKTCDMYNVGVMMPYMNYTPRTANEIITGYNQLYKENKQCD